MDAYTHSKDCRKGNVAALQGILASACTCSDSDLAYLLRVNAGFNHVDCVKLLLEKKADPSLSSCSLRLDHHGQRSSTGRNSLHEACLWGASGSACTRSEQKTRGGQDISFFASSHHFLHDYIKLNSNTGWVNNRSALTEALSHFSYHHSGQQPQAKELPQSHSFRPVDPSLRRTLKIHAKQHFWLDLQQQLAEVQGYFAIRWACCDSVVAQQLRTLRFRCLSIEVVKTSPFCFLCVHV